MLAYVHWFINSLAYADQTLPSAYPPLVFDTLLSLIIKRAGRYTRWYMIEELFQLLVKFSIGTSKKIVSQLEIGDKHSCIERNNILPKRTKKLKNTLLLVAKAGSYSKLD